MDDDATVCRTCLKFLKLGDGVALTDPDNFMVANMFRVIFPKAKVNIVENPTLCDECVKTLSKIIDFRHLYSETEQKMRSLIVESRINTVQFNVTMDNPNLEELHFDDIFNLRDHPSVGKQAHKCRKCRVVCSSLRQLALHIENMHESSDDLNMADLVEVIDFSNTSEESDELMESWTQPQQEEEAAAQGPAEELEEEPAEETSTGLPPVTDPNIFFN